MKESFFVWNDEDNDRDGDHADAVAAAPMTDAEIDEYVRLFSPERAPKPTNATATVRDLDTYEEKGEKPRETDTDSSDGPPSEASVQVALARFGHTSLRGMQGPALRSVFTGQDTIVLLPTGGGKSLCFQLPAVMQPGLVVVISPLLALMQDQVMALRRRGIRVEMLCSLVNAKDKRSIHDRLARDAAFPNHRDRIEILYTTPETLPTEALQAVLKALDRRQMLALFAIDEAHCISSWGHDFRPSYLKLGVIRKTFPDVPIMALTATATNQVRDDIRTELQLRDNTAELIGDFNRPNISYIVCNKDALGDDVGALLAYLERCHHGSVGIVYVHRRLDTEALVEDLQKRTESIRFAPYHAEIPLKQREQILLDWLKGKIDVICATIAFGMGIDHPAVRFVVHWNMPKSMESLYQEGGRAGRDGHRSHHVLLYSYQDYEMFQYLLQMAEEKLLEDELKGKRTNRKRVDTLRERLKNLKKVMEWATHKTCRRVRLLEYFGQETTAADCGGTCDHCNTGLLFESLPPLESHRPAANTYHLGPGEAPYTWRRSTRKPTTTTDHDQPPMEAVPRYRGDNATGAELPRFNLNLDRRVISPPTVASPRRYPSTPSPVRPPIRRRAQPTIPPAVRSIADYIAATADRRTIGRGWGAEPTYVKVDESSDEDDVKWINPETMKDERTQRPIKRPRHDHPTEVIVIDDSD